MGAITPYDSTNFLDADEYPSIIVDCSVPNHRYLQDYEDLKFSLEVLKGIYSDPDQKGIRPNRLRAITLRLITAQNHNLLAQARMNSGITKCFVLGILRKLNLVSSCNPQAIMVCPTIEMAQQLNAILTNMGRFVSRLRSQVVGIGAVITPWPHVIVATPAVIHNLIATKKINPFSIKTTVLVAADEIAQTPQVRGNTASLMKCIDADYCQILCCYSTWTDRFSSFCCDHLGRFKKWNKLWVNTEEYSVYHSHLHKLVIYDDDDTKSVALLRTLALLPGDEQIIVYANPGKSMELLRSDLGTRNVVFAPNPKKRGRSDLGTRDVVFAPNPQKRGEEDPVARFKSRKARILVTSEPLFTGYRESSFDLSKVRFVIFFNIPVAREGVVDFECYYRLAAKAGINCDGRGCVIHMLSEGSEQALMDQVEARSGRVAMRAENEGCDGMDDIIQNLKCCLS